MKSIRILISILACMAAVSFVVAHSPAAPQEKAPMAAKEKTTKVYSCSQCHVAAMKAGKCGCGEEMKAIQARIAYVCKTCTKSSATAGNCKGCSKEMTKMAISYVHEDCSHSSAKPGACPCGAPLKKEMAKVVS
jgi:hypothetical protein